MQIITVWLLERTYFAAIPQGQNEKAEVPPGMTINNRFNSVRQDISIRSSGDPLLAMLVAEDK